MGYNEPHMIRKLNKDQTLSNQEFQFLTGSRIKIRGSILYEYSGIYAKFILIVLRKLISLSVITR